MDALDQKIIDQIDSISSVLSRHNDRDLYGPAQFWESLGEKHKSLIREHGFRSFKRTINFEYHQWGLLSLGDPKIKSLWRELLKNFRIPYGFLRARIDAKAVAGIEQINPSAYAVFMGLLWQYALLKDRLGCLKVCSEPLLGQPIPVTYGGRLISQDLATSSLELNRIAECMDMSKIKRVAEIGAGYGRLAYLMMTRFPLLEYYIFDIPPALVLSQNYLASTLGDDSVERCNGSLATLDEGPGKPRVKACLPHELELRSDDYFDLVINISSFDEMPSEQVQNYFSLIDKKCRGWFYIKGHAKAPDWCKVSGGGLAELPYPNTWELVYQGKDPFSPTFIERIYSLRAGSGKTQQ
jgi:putative sugar O-methyltransferase